eukprot:1156190-Pelagomonas_calceolata.AAC.2
MPGDAQKVRTAPLKNGPRGHDRHHDVLHTRLEDQLDASKQQHRNLCRNLLRASAQSDSACTFLLQLSCPRRQVQLCNPILSYPILSFIV